LLLLIYDYELKYYICQDKFIIFHIHANILNYNIKYN